MQRVIKNYFKFIHHRQHAINKYAKFLTDKDVIIARYFASFVYGGEPRQELLEIPGINGFPIYVRYLVNFIMTDQRIHIDDAYVLLELIVDRINESDFWKDNAYDPISLLAIKNEAGLWKYESILRQAVGSSGHDTKEDFISKRDDYLRSIGQ